MSNSEILAGIFAAGAAIAIFSLVIGLVCTILLICSLWTIFKKAGKEGWEAIIPGYNLATMCDITGFTPYLGFLVIGAFIPGLNTIVSLALIVLYVFIDIKLANAFGKSTGYAIGLMLLPIIFYPMLAFDKQATYNSDFKFKGVGFSNYTNGSNGSTNNNTFYAENMNNTQGQGPQPTQETQQTTQGPEPTNTSYQDNPISEPSPTNDANVDPIQNTDNDNNNGQW